MRIEELGLVSYLSLDQWEIPRDHVVLNRKLGEGAFGTVYGGEALVNDKWQGVAVKTLKVGSNAEEKVGFAVIFNALLRFIIKYTSEYGMIKQATCFSWTSCSKPK